MSSDYDGQDQAYQDLLSECAMLHAYLQNIAALIHYQAPLREQDRWLATMIECGIYHVEDDDE